MVFSFSSVSLIATGKVFMCNVPGQTFFLFESSNSENEMKMTAAEGTLPALPPRCGVEDSGKEN